MACAAKRADKSEMHRSNSYWIYYKKGTSSEWHYYISSRQLTTEELLHHARMEWSVESMHWLLDVHFEENWCRIESKEVQQCLNMFRKTAINLIKRFKSSNDSKQAISHLMFECLLDSNMILRILNENWFPWKYQSSYWQIEKNVI